MTESNKNNENFSLSIIIPVGRADASFVYLLRDLKQTPRDTEIIVSAAEEIEAFSLEARAEFEVLKKTHEFLRWEVSPRKGRARQLNFGARLAKNKHLWFLHADTRLGVGTFESLLDALTKYPNDLIYFELKFYDGPSILRLNERGVRFRSDTLGMPFGDQGFCILKKKFFDLGEFSESVEYGEDHLFAWEARRQGVNLRSTGEPIFTSARKYVDNGFIQTWIKHIGLTYKQAIPQYIKLKATEIRSR